MCWAGAERRDSAARLGPIHLKSNSGIEIGRTRRRRSRRRADAQRAEGQTVHWPFPPFPNNSASADRATLSRTTNRRERDG